VVETNPSTEHLRQITSADDDEPVLETTVCQHCGRHPFAGQPRRPSVIAPRPPMVFPPNAHTGTPSGAPVPASDHVDDDERWLWQLVEQGTRTRADAPTAPTSEEIAAARRAVSAANAACHRVQAQVSAIEQALAQPSSWLRPTHRAALAGALRRGRAALIAATATREQADRAFVQMDRLGAQRRSYFAVHRPQLESASAARRELNRRVDDLINAYARESDPPAWFRFGLGYPPRPEHYARWLEKARAAIAYRRRHGIDHPLEPTGVEPVDMTHDSRD
jgi:hypothetical protein